MEIKNSTTGVAGYLEEVQFDEKDSILIFQLPRPTNMLSEVYVEGALRVLKECLPEGRQAMVIGADVNVYELAGADAVMLKLRGLIR